MRSHDKLSYMQAQLYSCAVDELHAYHVMLGLLYSLVIALPSTSGLAKSPLSMLATKSGSRPGDAVLKGSEGAMAAEFSP